MNMAHYEKGQGVIKSLDFTDSAKVNFEPASTFMRDNEDYEDVVSELQKLCPEAIEDYVKMIFLYATRKGGINRYASNELLNLT